MRDIVARLMKMMIEGATKGVMNGKHAIALQAPKYDILAFLREFEDKYPIEVEIKPRRKKRSQNANSYMWVLCDKIAQAVRITKEEVYQSHIQEVGVFDDVWVKTDAVEQFCMGWRTNGVGWVTETIRIKGDWTEIRAYYGSSTYDTKEMSRLIDNVVYEAKGLGIETLSPDELERMKQAWNTQ